MTNVDFLWSLAEGVGIWLMTGGWRWMTEK